MDARREACDLFHGRQTRNDGALDAKRRSQRCPAASRRQKKRPDARGNDQSQRRAARGALDLTPTSARHLVSAAGWGHPSQTDSGRTITGVRAALLAGRRWIAYTSDE